MRWLRDFHCHAMAPRVSSPSREGEDNRRKQGQTAGFHRHAMAPRFSSPCDGSVVLIANKRGGEGGHNQDEKPTWERNSLFLILTPKCVRVCECVGEETSKASVKELRVSGELRRCPVHGVLGVSRRGPPSNPVRGASLRVQPLARVEVFRVQGSSVQGVRDQMPRVPGSGLSGAGLK